MGNDPGVKEYLAFMKTYLPNADLSNSNYAAGYHYANLLMKVLKGCKDDFSRRQHHAPGSLAARGAAAAAVAGNDGIDDADDYLPFQQLRLRRFDGKSWVGFGDILDDR